MGVAELKGCLGGERKPWEKSLVRVAVRYLYKITSVDYCVLVISAAEVAAPWDP